MIINKSNNELISEKEIVCKTPLSWTLGLMFQPKRNALFSFPTKRRIFLHNWFVFYPLDLIILDENKQVIEYKENFKPFSLWNSRTEGKYLIELGKDRIKNKIKIGHCLEFKKNN
ncbi:MAG: DUF192 domain-containing protein [archaeon]|nr:DUF192 domain-containing protein [archaeon]